MPKRNDLKKLARIRLKEAKALLNCGLYDGSCYLAGYVVELALKARICRVLDLDQYPESGEFSKLFKTHNFDNLLKLAGLERKFDHAKSNNLDLLSNWSIVTQWNEAFRYKPVGSNQKEIAESIINSLEDSTNGVFVWITKYW